ncbi:MAG: hypothetical protein K2L24_03775, partial [Opitutales bacterium]|nr:hypothetical protein [Opitutales bacterium]
GFVHCDIKIENIILTIYNILKLIDLGGLSHFGQEIYVHSSNGAPETVYAHLLGIPEMHKAQPAYDIYCSAVIILSCLFGQAGVDAARQYFYVRNAQDKTISGRKNAKAKLLQTTEDILELKRNETRAKLPVYIRYLADHGFRNDRHNLRTQFFENLLNSLNNRMGQPGPNGEIHKNYPPHVLYVITKLLLRITSINPQDRPSAIEILEILQDLALSDWDNEKYLIDNLGKDLPTVDFDTDWLKENPFKIPTQQQRY